LSTLFHSIYYVFTLICIFIVLAPDVPTELPLLVVDVKR
jgi:hypothetical protein